MIKAFLKGVKEFIFVILWMGLAYASVVGITYLLWLLGLHVAGGVIISVLLVGIVASGIMEVALYKKFPNLYDTK